MSLELLLIATYCWVDEQVKQLESQVGPFRKRGPQPSLRDAEVLTMELVGALLGYGQDKALYRYFRTHFIQWFPSMPSRCNFCRQTASLGPVKVHLQRKLASTLESSSPYLVTDGFPMSTCHVQRAGRRRLYRQETTTGYCASKRQYFHGFKGLVVLGAQGVVLDWSLGTAIADERALVCDCLETMQGKPVLADKGYIGEDFQNTLRQQAGVQMYTPKRKNMKGHDPRPWEAWMGAARRKVETVIEQLTGRFHLATIQTRNLLTLQAKIGRVLLAHTLGLFFLRKLGFFDLKLERLLDF